MSERGTSFPLRKDCASSHGNNRELAAMRNEVRQIKGVRFLSSCEKRGRFMDDAGEDETTRILRLNFELSQKIYLLACNLARRHSDATLWELSEIIARLFLSSRRQDDFVFSGVGLSILKETLESLVWSQIRLNKSFFSLFDLQKPADVAAVWRDAGLTAERQRLYLACVGTLQQAILDDLRDRLNEWRDLGVVDEALPTNNLK